MTAEEWAVIAAELHIGYDRELTDGWPAFWFDVLAPYPEAVVREASSRHKVGPYGHRMPTGGELARLCEELTAEEAYDFDAVWEIVQRQVRRVGSWGQPEGLSREAESLVSFLGGWRAVCALEVETIPTVRAQARMAWADIRRRSALVASRQRLGIEDPARRELEP